jgi:hypothetical protein
MMGRRSPSSLGHVPSTRAQKSRHVRRACHRGTQAMAGCAGNLSSCRGARLHDDGCNETARALLCRLNNAQLNHTENARTCLSISP